MPSMMGMAHPARKLLPKPTTTTTTTAATSKRLVLALIFLLVVTEGEKREAAKVASKKGIQNLVAQRQVLFLAVDSFLHLVGNNGANEALRYLLVNSDGVTKSREKRLEVLSKRLAGLFNRQQLHVQPQNSLVRALSDLEGKANFLIGINSDVFTFVVFVSHHKLTTVQPEKLLDALGKAYVGDPIFIEGEPSQLLLVLNFDADHHCDCCQHSSLVRRFCLRFCFR
mmetsp:Transcript_11218/g.29583  ORF Transcript_11218/g.29583 Transcript_11218/m.29583 type:complete len:226 (-) Transcript_11218:82-759(-)